MDASVVNTEICNLQQAEEFLSQNNDCQVLIEHLLDELCMQHEFWADITDVENDIKETLHQLYSSNSNLEQCEIFNFKISLECVCFNRIHSFIMPQIYQKFQYDDEYFFNKSAELCNANVTAEQMGAPENYAVPLLAAVRVVELSRLDNHKSPLEKLYCLCTTYDLIFAELKTVLIDIISKFSVAESEIPVINNSDIIPILMTVIIRSKLLHLSSNIYYIETFLGLLNNKDNIRHILKSFKEAIGRLKILTKESLMPGCEKVCRDLDLIKLIKITNEVNTKLQQIEEVPTPLDGQMLRLTDLIITSTNENHPVI